MKDQNKNFMIGIFVIVALAIAIGSILYLNPKPGDEGQTIHVFFSNIDKVGVGTRVLFAGKHVGEVSHITEVENARNPKHVKDGRVYIYELSLTFDSRVEVYTTDRVALSTSGLLGEKSVEITPRPAPIGKPLIRVRKQILYAESLGSIEEAITEVTYFARSGQEIIKKFNQGLDELKENEFFATLGIVVNNLGEITTELNQEGKWSEFTTNIAQMAKNLREVSSVLNEGQGTIGKLVHNDDLYLRLTSILSKGETVMDDINHYGLLFQNNKSWQRLRARRVNLMARLQSPIEFQNFFNDEIDQVSTSLARVNMILHESQSPCCLPVVCSPEFQRVFADLLRRIEGLEQNIKLYDQQLVETLENKCTNQECCR